MTAKKKQKKAGVIPCPIPGCSKKVPNKGALASHMKARHPDKSREVQAPAQAPAQAQPGTGQKIEIGQQGADILQKPAEPQQKPQETATGQPQAQPGQPQQPGEIQPIAPSNEEMYTALADSVHQTLNNLVILVTKKKVSVGAKEIDRLNKCGVMILRKYDTEGKILEYSPEAAYILTLLDVGTQVAAALQKQKPEEQKQQAQQPQAIPAPASNTQAEVKEFNRLLEK